MNQKLIIEGRLIGLNEYINMNRTHKNKGSNAKKNEESLINTYIMVSRLKPIEKYPIKLDIKWYEKDKRRDVDNITFAVKFILDALVKKGILIDDSRKYVTSISHDVLVDKKRPRIEVEII